MDKLGKFIVLADNDGTIRDTNSVKDDCLNDFCNVEFGKAINSDVLPTELHRKMHGRPMAEIFVEIAKVVYARIITLDEGQAVTERLNEFIKDEYVGRRVYEGAEKFYRDLKAMGCPMFILTGMEPDLVQAGLEHHGLGDVFEDILGAPKTKEENIKNILDKYPGYRILAMGDAMSEYKATMAYEGTIFLAFDFENRAKRVFPEHVKVFTAYDEQVWSEIYSHLN